MDRKRVPEEYVMDLESGILKSTYCDVSIKFPMYNMDPNLWWIIRANLLFKFNR